MKTNLHPRVGAGYLWSIAICSMFYFAVSSSLYAQTIDIGLTTRRTIGSDIFGFNTGTTIRGGSSCLNPNLLAKMPLMKPQIFRFPAGAFSTWYNWREGWVYDDPNVPQKYKSLTKVPNRLEDYKVLRDAAGATSTILGVNMILSDINEQLAMLRHADSIGIPVEYVELGNEFFLEGDEDSAYILQVFPEPSDYGKAATIWADSIHKYFPNAKVAAQGVFDKNAAPRRKIWNDSVLAHLEGEDAMTFHFYYASADADSLETLAEKLDVNMSDVPEWLYQPYKAWEILSTKSMVKVRPGKEIWITEFNLSDHERPTHGYWTHGLFQALQTLLLLQDERITKVTPHGMCGTAVYASHFYDTEGFEFGNGEDASFIPPPVKPATTFWGLTATGNNLMMVGKSLNNKSFASQIQFSPNPQVMTIEKGDTIYYNGLFGFLFNNNNSTDAALLNLTGTAQTINTAAMFPSGGTYEMRHAPPLQLIATAQDVTIVNATLPQSLVLQPYSITRISATTVPDAPPVVSITVNGDTVICSGDSVELDGGAGHYSYNWSNGKTSRKIWVTTTGDYSLKVYDSPVGYYSETSVHITVNPSPVVPNIKVDGSKAFCEGGSVLVYLGPNFTYSNVSYLWPLTGDTTVSSLATTTGNHYLLITDNQNGCTAVSDTETITVHALPEPVISAIGPVQACYDVGVTLQVNDVYNDYVWSGGGSLQSKNYTVSGTYWVNVGDMNGCHANSNAIEITVWEPEFPVISAMGPTTYCIETPTTIATIPGYSYQWFKGVAAISGGTGQTWTPVGSGLYKVTVTDQNGCSKKNNTGLDITVNSLVAPAITVSNGSLLCQGEVTTLSMPPGYTGYSWSTGAIGNSIIVGNSGSYTCTLTDTNGCVSTSPAKVITVNPLPQPIITAAGPTSFCYDQSVSLSAQPGYNQYTWSNGKSGQTISAETNGPITVTVKDVNNCTNISPALDLTVWEPPVPVVDLIGPDTYCIENPSTLSTLSGFTYQWKKGLTFLENATGQTYQPTTTGTTYKVVIMDEHGCTKTSANVAVTVNVAATPNLTVVGGSTICQGQSTTINAPSGYSSYLWSSGQTTTSISVNQGGNYNVTVTDLNGCTTVSATKVIVVNPLPAPVITALGATSFCDGGSVTLDAGSGYSGYAWSNGKTTQTVSITASGTYSVTVTGQNGCSAQSAPVVVTEWIPPTPVITSSAGSSSFCASSGVYLTIATAAAYQWQKNGANIAGATMQNYIPTSGGNYKVIATDINGCSKTSSSYTVTLFSIPAPVISGNNFICQGSSATLSCGTFSSYAWSTGATTSTINVSGSGSYSVTVTDGNGCQGTSPLKTTTVSPLPVPVISAQSATQFCDGGSVVLDAGSGYSVYNWSNGKTTQTNTITSSGSYSVTVTDNIGCSGTSLPVSVVEWIPPVPVVSSSTGQTTYCANSGVYLSTLGGYMYQWLKSGVNVAGATSQQFTPAVSGSYKVVITDVNQCSKTSAAFSVTINNNPVPVISGPATVCPGSSINLSCGTYSAYAWSTGSSASNINVNGAGSFVVTVTDVNGCNGTSAQKTVSLASLPTPVIDALGATQFCDGGTVTLDAGAGYSTYLWSNGKTTQTNAITASGTFTVTVTNANNCSGISAPVTVTEWILPAVTVTAVGPTTYCKNSGTYLTTLNGPYTYQWLKGSAAQNGATNQTFAPVSSGTYKVKVTDGNGCNKTSSGLKVTVNSNPTANISISGSSNICSGQTKNISANTGTGLSYVWKRDNNTISGATASTYTAAVAGSYQCVVTNTSGCSTISNTIVITSNCKDGSQIADKAQVSWFVYPNPTKGELHIRLNLPDLQQGNYVAEIRNMLGALIWRQESAFNDNLIAADIYLDATVSSGQYIIIVRVDDHLYSSRFVVANE
jgi:hypothetical protein